MNDDKYIETVLIKDIDDFCERHQMAVATFGRRALNNPAFYSDLKAGRSPTGKTEKKLRNWMKNQNIKLRGKRNVNAE